MSGCSLYHIIVNSWRPFTAGKPAWIPSIHVANVKQNVLQLIYCQPSSHNAAAVTEKLTSGVTVLSWH
jgi:hypothetical protein